MTCEQIERRERLFAIAFAIANPHRPFDEQAEKICCAAYRFDLQGDRMAAEIARMGTGKVSG